MSFNFNYLGPAPASGITLADDAVRQIALLISSVSQREVAEVLVSDITGSNGWEPASAVLSGTLGTFNTYGDLGRYEYSVGGYKISLSVDSSDNRMLLVFEWPDAGSVTYQISIGENAVSVAEAAMGTDLSYANWTPNEGHTRTVQWGSLLFRTSAQTALPVNQSLDVEEITVEAD